MLVCLHPMIINLEWMTDPITCKPQSALRLSVCLQNIITIIHPYQEHIKTCEMCMARLRDDKAMAQHFRPYSSGINIITAFVMTRHRNHCCSQHPQEHCHDYGAGHTESSTPGVRLFFKTGKGHNEGCRCLPIFFFLFVVIFGLLVLCAQFCSAERERVFLG